MREFILKDLLHKRYHALLLKVSATHTIRIRMSAGYAHDAMVQES